MGNTALSYNIAIEGLDEQVLIDWGNEKGWQTTHKDLLASAHRISLIPKEITGQPIVSIALDNEKRWIVFSRVVGRIVGGDGAEVRLYCIGWQRTVKKRNEKMLLWVYPGGAIECADNPTMVDRFLK